MQVSVETTTGLERRMIVELPAQDIDGEVKTRLKSLARTARIDGFRPGKIPMSVVEQRYADGVRQEVLRDAIGTSFNEAIHQQNIRMAGGPRIQTLPEQPAQGLSYAATFEVYPEFELAAAESLSIEKPLAEVIPDNVDKMIHSLRQQRQTWEPVERGAELGDQLQLEIRTRMDGEEAKSGPSQQTSVVLGASVLPKDVEEKLFGLSIATEVVIDHHLPDDFHDAERAGKAIQYTVKLLALYAPTLPEIDEEFARSLGIDSGSVEQLRSEVQENMQYELHMALQNRLKQRVMDALLAANPFDVPNALVEREAEALLKQERERMQSQGRTAQEAASLEGSIFTTVARRRVALGLLLSEIIKVNAMNVDAERVRNMVDNQAATYEDPDEVIKWYYDSPERLRQMESLALEDQVVEWILERATVTEQQTSFEELMNQIHPVTA